MSQGETHTIDPRWGEPSTFHDPQVLAHFEARPTDVLITTAPKAGTTWMQQILHQLKTGGDTSFGTIYDVVPWLEMPKKGRTYEEALAQYEAMEDPRLFKTHCTYEQTPGVGTAKIVLSSRDPRDCCVSSYHHMSDLTDETRRDFDMSEAGDFESFFDRWMGFSAWFRNVTSWWPHRDDPGVLWLRYQDMKRDLPTAVDRLIQFLGWTLSDDARARAIEHSSFEWMRDNRLKFQRHEADGKPLFKPHGFIRKGAVGDHKALMSPEQEERILARCREELDPACLAFLDLA